MEIRNLGKSGMRLSVVGLGCNNFGGRIDEDASRKVIDKASFQSFGCETAIAVASLATELIRGKTAEEALALKTEELAGELGPLPPMKIHCAQLVEGALRSALTPESASTQEKLRVAYTVIAPTQATL